MANDGTGASWVAATPADADKVKFGGQEIRGLRVGVEMRMNKEHGHLVTGTVASESVGITGGGDHLEGSARITVATSVPTNLVVGRLDSGGNADDVTISTNEALAHGRMWRSNHNLTICCYLDQCDTIRTEQDLIGNGLLRGDDYIIFEADNYASALSSSEAVTRTLEDQVARGRY